MIAYSTKVIAALALVFVLIFLPSFIPMPAKKGSGNLKVLPKDISEEELMTIMKDFNRSLGVKCSFCHVKGVGEDAGLDFASDENDHKGIARKMMKMTDGINKKYIDKMVGHVPRRYGGVTFRMESVTCVTCHMGQVHPVVSADSLMVK